jgi:hypothetical protein
MLLDPIAFVQKWNNRFEDNDMFEIGADDLREFGQDVADSFGDLGEHRFNELVLPQNVIGSKWYITDTGVYEARRNFVASSAPVNGPNWRLIAGFQGQRTSLNAADILDASEAGRTMLKAPTAAAQRALVNNPGIAQNQYALPGTTHPGWTTEDGDAGSWKWVIQGILALQAKPTVQVPLAPAAPTAGQVDDTADTFSFLPNPIYPSFAQYKVAGLPGVTGAVVLDATNSYVQGNRIYVKVVGTVAKGGLAVYVAGSGSVPDGKPLTNADPFTGTAVVTPPTPTNQAPTVNLTGSSSSVNTGQSVTLTASPYDSDGTIAKVEYFDGGAKIGETTAAPWSILTPGLSQGQHNFTAKTTDDKGATGTSSTFTVAVSTQATVYNGSYTAKCGSDKAGTGPDVYRTAQGASQAEADAAARNAAIAALVCSVKPTYEWTLTGPSDSDSTGITHTTDGGAYLLQYNRIFNGDSTPKRMDIFSPVTGQQLTAEDFPASYVGQGFLLIVGSTTYGGTFIDGIPTLTIY